MHSHVLAGFKSELFKLAEAKRGSTEDKRAVMNFIMKHPYPEDKSFHNFAEQRGKSPHEMEDSAYALLSDFLAQGKSKGKTVKVDPIEAKMGRKVEMEHTTNPDIADKVQKDHHAEPGMKNYYKGLNKMEDQLKKRSQ